ncbi:MAG: FimV/HubP family polar landmark protein [Cellvibrionaceae bacterium]
MVSHVKRKQQLLAVAISLALTVQAPSAISLGLGAAQVKSQIGEPLLAEIPILDSRSYDLNEILVRQVRGKLAQQLGFDLAADSAGYFLKVVERDDRLFLLVRSKRIMAEPFVSVLVELEWPNGKLYRDYNLLLDLAPLPVNAPQSAPVQSRTSAPASTRTSPPSTSSTQTPQEFAQSQRGNYQAIAPSRSSLRPSSSEGWRVGGGDTLSQIAQKIRPDDQIKLTAVVEALFQLNPSAFANGNINRMQGGSLLKLPSPENFAAMPRWDGKPGVVQAARGMVSSGSGRSLNIDSSNIDSSSIDSSNANTDLAGAAEVGQARPQQPSSGRYQQAGTSRSSAPSVQQTPSASSSSSLPPLQPLESYRIQSGDTLSQVAQRLRRDPSVKLEHMMQLLFEHNPQAFTNGDINQLQLGASLQVPPHGGAQAVTRAMPEWEPVEGLVESGVDRNVEPPSPVSPDSLTASFPSEQSALESETRLTLSAQSNLQQNDATQDSSAKEILSQIDAVAELVDKVNRENQSIRQRIERIEQSEQLALLERLLELQTRQIQNLREAMLAEQSDGESVQTGLVSSDLKPGETAVLGELGAVESSELAILESHLAEQSQGATLGESQSPDSSADDAQVVATTGQQTAPEANKSDAPVAKRSDQKSQSFAAVLWLSLGLAVAGFLGFLLIARRRQVFDWLNQKLSLFEQNKEDASLPRIWDPELGAWRVKEEIRKPMLTPLATSLKDIEEGLAAHEAKQAAAERNETQNDGYLQNPDENPSSTQVDDARSVLDSLTDASEQGALATANDSRGSGIDAMFEEIPEDQSEIEPPQLSDKVEEDSFPLLGEEQIEHQTSDLVLDNLDGEFEFSLPDDLFEDPGFTDKQPQKPEKNKAQSSEDARVKASIVEKTKNYNPESIDDVLDGWLHNSIPAAELSEYEDVISEAMIYAAYGRHDHAEQLLLEQLAQSPDEEKLRAALDEVRKSNAQFKSGQGFGVSGEGETSFELPGEPEGLGELRLDLDDGFSGGSDPGSVGDSK